MNIIETKNLVKRFNSVFAIDHLSIKFKKGQIIGIIGPNGSGKTTFLNLLSGVLEIDGGEVVIGGIEKISRILPHRIASYGITRTFQGVRLFEQMTILDNILIIVAERNVFGSLFKKYTNYHYEIVKEVLQKVGLWEKRNQLASSLSYGQRKLLEIARALAMKADLYLFDEPFAGLFPEMKKIISGIIRELRQQNKTIILIEHDIGLIRELCDDVFVMNEGRLLTQGRPADALKRRDVIEAYLGY